LGKKLVKTSYEFVVSLGY
jgi:hypothetical protein